MARSVAFWRQEVGEDEHSAVRQKETETDTGREQRMSILELYPWRKGDEQPERELADDWLAPLHQRIGRAFEEFLNEDFPCTMKLQRNGRFSPDIDVSETRQWVEVTAELPGIHEDEVSVTLSDGVLTIRGEKLHGVLNEDVEEKHHRLERRFGAFDRSFQLPPGIDCDRVSATFDRGILRIIVGKEVSWRPELRPCRS